MVPPAMMTARHSFSTWAKWTAGFNSRNLTLLSDKVPGHKTNMVLLLLLFFTTPSFHHSPLFGIVLLKWYLVCAPPLCRQCCCWWEPWRNPPPASWEMQTALSQPLQTPAGQLKTLHTWEPAAQINRYEQPEETSWIWCNLGLIAASRALNVNFLATCKLSSLITACMLFILLPVNFTYKVMFLGVV